ncbi:hypothetical protein [Enterococcus termitis]|uniref:Uncharacterized protein n=1 Tax=Enterococcus termitis TaxID=332950 RepID=A0A1E5GZP4_9ENTE|nr:hypothetical protein [Enterococcus termitis]OEG18146.1 hypothetical protein BCR25_16770 [Enterococcus termitis]
MAFRNWEQNTLFFYNILREIFENQGLTVAYNPETHDGSLPYAWVDQLNAERRQISRRGTRQGDVYDYSATVHIFYPWNRQGDLIRAIDAFDDELNKRFRTDTEFRLLREKDGTLHGLLNLT